MPPAHAGDKKSAPAPHPSAPHVSGGGGAPHMPGGMGGGAHMPGSMGGGAHIPGSMGGGAHIPGGMEGSGRRESGTAAASRDESHGRAETHRAQSGGLRQAGTAGRDAHGAQSREAAAGERTGLHGQGAGAEHRDARIGGNAAMHTRLAAGVAAGAGAGLAARHFGDAGGHDFRARPADRDVGRDRAFASAHAHDFHARFARDFTPAELGRWRGGDWSAGWHFGRFGWWWDVDGVWYPYAEPIYPFPLEVSAITVYGNDYVELPALQANPAIPPLPAAPATLYSCAAPAGYFPTVAACSQPWQMAGAPPPGGQP